MSKFAGLAERIMPASELGNDPERIRRTRLTLAFTAATSACVLLLGSFQIFFGSPWIALVTALGPLLSALVIVILRVTRSEVIAAHVLAFFWAAGITAVVILRGGLGQPVVMTYGVVPMIAFVLADKRSGLAWLIICLSLLLALAASVWIFGPLPIVRLSAPIELNLLGHAVFVFACYLFASLYEYFRQRAIEDLQAAQTKLLEAERRRLESEAEATVLRSSRMAELGTLAAGVAHEINNPLTYVMTNIRLLLENGADEKEGRAPEQERLLSESLEGASRIERIVRDISLFSRVEDEDVRKPIDVHEVIDSSVSLLWNQVRHRAELVKQFGETPPVLVSGSRLGQVFVNLLLNAAQAIPEGRAGRIVISTSVDEEKRVVVELTDNGVGMSAGQRERALEPFFTTKPVGEGTGLGLSICYGIVTSFGGELHIRSEKGEGTTILVILPAASSTDSATISDDVDTESVEEPLDDSPMSILVVDDDVLVLRSMSRMLRDHRVEAVGSGSEALDRLRQENGFDVILCDLMMPDMTGMDLYEEASALEKGLEERFLFMTGGAFTDRARRFVEEVDTLTLEKPVSPEQLQAGLRAVRHS